MYCRLSASCSSWHRHPIADQSFKWQVDQKRFDFIDHGFSLNASALVCNLRLYRNDMFWALLGDVIITLSPLEV